MGWKKHIQEESTQLWWNYCGKIFRNGKEVDHYMYKACESIGHKYTPEDEVESNKEEIVVENGINFKEGHGN